MRFLLGEVQGLTEDLLDSRRRRPLVRIGAVPHAMLGVMQEFAAHWSGKEGVRLRLEDGPTSALVEKLLRGDLDAIVAPLTPEAGTSFTSAVKSRPLYSESIVIAASVKNPLAKAKMVSLDDLEKADWVLPGRLRGQGRRWRGSSCGSGGRHLCRRSKSLHSFTGWRWRGGLRC
ncbi:MAG: LysR family transcriptional regulator substrate-binding protein [Betaproteobacteria bacterium]|nr:LysR family transcriptional regulator substrate-binding protein [Betaproteobacteria bacterium]